MVLAENVNKESKHLSVHTYKSSVKGRVQSTIPTDVLTALGLKQGDWIDWRIEERDGEVVAIAKKR